MLTLGERKAYLYIKSFMLERCHAPTTLEIAKGLGISSRGVVYRYLKQLKEKGYIKLTPNRHRNIVLNKVSELGIPLVGNISAGLPIELMDQNQTIDLGDLFLGENRYALRVNGSSMTEEGIRSGDIIIYQRSSSADHGQIVVALIDEKRATLKRLFYNDDETITLLPSNPAYKPKTYTRDRLSIQGVYVGLLRVDWNAHPAVLSD